VILTRVSGPRRLRSPIIGHLIDLTCTDYSLYTRKQDWQTEISGESWLAVRRDGLAGLGLSGW